MKNNNKCEVPTLNYRSIIATINKKICRMSDDETESVRNILLFHGCEPSAAAERISEELGVSYQCIYDLL